MGSEIKTSAWDRMAKEGVRLISDRLLHGVSVLSDGINALLRHR
jgi:hypothetical protein